MSDDTEIQTQNKGEFQEGDVVQLKSGGMPMTFRSYHSDGQVFVVYATRDGLVHSMLPAGMLRRAADPGVADAAERNPRGAESAS